MRNLSNEDILIKTLLQLWPRLYLVEKERGREGVWHGRKKMKNLEGGNEVSK